MQHTVFGNNLSNGPLLVWVLVTPHRYYFSRRTFRILENHLAFPQFVLNCFHWVRSYYLQKTRLQGYNLLWCLENFVKYKETYWDIVKLFQDTFEGTVVRFSVLSEYFVIPWPLDAGWKRALVVDVVQFNKWLKLWSNEASCIVRHDFP